MFTVCLIDEAKSNSIQKLEIQSDPKSVGSPVKTDVVVRLGDQSIVINGYELIKAVKNALNS